ncbi:methyl-accepting chemotaxis protein [Cryptosporangium phraense]|uniref:Methyl-accepting chemotaxis protein n=1 Tax=Cryptosporangium phraense TaxID=2593070 RepID=A0A545APQ8_9ACTN|nr:methyl-accepting chemotaxis protein [Cryptosporangium phraense]TQS43286.1 methyl-accepting chemotaxis protein [Cryptosporangium phraense]
MTPHPPTGLRPVLAVLDRLRTTSRLGLVIVLLLVPGLVATVEYTLSEHRQIAFSEAERDGVHVLKPTLHALAAVVGGRAPDLGPTDRAVREESQLGLSSELAAVRAAGATDTPAGREKVAESIGDLVTEIGNASNLILDPDLDSFYVMDSQVVQIPRILIAAASAAATTGVADRAVIAGELSTAAEALRADVKTAVANTHASGLGPRLTGLDTLADATDALAARITATLDGTGADAGAVATAAEAAIDASEGALDSLLSTRISGREAARNVILTVTTVGFVLAFWLAFAVWWRSRHDVALVLAGVQAVAARDTSEHSLPSGRDEFGDIGRALEQARENLASQDVALAEAARAQEQAAKENFAQQRRAEKQARQLAQQLIEESVSALTSELSDVAGEVEAVRASAGSIHERVGNADEVLRGLLSDAGNADAVATALGERLQRVAGMTKLIASVADQTKMLALNATIEAARAGDAGEGFGVVANEVKELAATTARSTEEITGTIQALEREAGAVSTTISAMTTGIGGVDEATGALLEVANHQQATVASMDQRLANALERVRGMSDLRNQMERRADERIPVRGVGVFAAGGRRYEVTLKDASEGGVRAAFAAGESAAGATSGTLELPIAGMPAMEVAVARGGSAGGEVVFTFRNPPQPALTHLRAYLDAQL